MSSWYDEASIKFQTVYLEIVFCQSFYFFVRRRQIFCFSQGAISIAMATSGTFVTINTTFNGRNMGAGKYYTHLSIVFN